MYRELVEKVAGAAKSKVDMADKSFMKFMILSIMAGIFVGIGVILVSTIGGVLGDEPYTKIILGTSFGIALSLVTVVGSELFTGNNFIMTVGAMDKAVTWAKVGKVWLYSYIGNLVGSVFIAWLYVQTGLVKGGTASFFYAVSSGKMSTPFMELFVRGIFCNFLVCLAVLSFMKLKNEVAKLIMIWWCLFAFITSGFEHSIANMSMLAVAIMVPGGEAVSLGGYVANLIPVTLGNMVGGIALVGAVYGYVGNGK